MSFLTLDGLEIPINRGGEVEPQTGGEFGRAFDGTPMSDRRYRKRRWRFQTTTLEPALAREIEAMVDGEGDAFPYNTDLFSTKGVAPTVGTFAPLNFGIGADGDPVVDPTVPTGRPESKFGSAALFPGFGSTNLLTANSRNFEAGTNWTPAFGAVITIDTANFIQGLQGIKVATSGAANASSELVSASSATVYAGSVYVKPKDFSTLVRVTLQDDDTGQIAIANIVCDTDTWTRIDLTGTTGAAATTINMRIELPGAAPTAFFVDAAQIETGSVSNMWGDPTNALTDLAYPTSLVAFEEALTINLWARVRSGGNFLGGGGLVLALGPNASQTDNSMLLLTQSTLDNVVLFSAPSGGPFTSIDTGAGIWNGQYRMITAVLNNSPDVGRSKREIFIDGVLNVSDNPATLPTGSLFTDVEVGHTAGIAQLDDPMDGLSIDKFAWGQEHITAAFAEVNGRFAPRLEASGDSMRGLLIPVDPRLLNSAFNPQGDGAGVWNNTARRVNFELLQV